MSTPSTELSRADIERELHIIIGRHEICWQWLLHQIIKNWTEWNRAYKSTSLLCHFSIHFHFSANGKIVEMFQSSAQTFIIVATAYKDFFIPYYECVAELALSLYLYANEWLLARMRFTAHTKSLAQTTHCYFPMACVEIFGDIFLVANTLFMCILALAERAWAARL